MGRRERPGGSGRWRRRYVRSEGRSRRYTARGDREGRARDLREQPGQRDFWLGRGKASPEELRTRYGGCKPCICGSDAHELSRVAKPAEDRFCWVKGAATFDALRQACIDPERAYIGSTPPAPAAPSQVIDQIIVAGAPWARTPLVRLNPGLVAIIGARGSGKTALTDIIAAGCGSYKESERPSFLARAAEHLAGAQVTLKWLSVGAETCPLDSPVDTSADAYPRARYLSQQFVEDLCSNEGMPALIGEIERVIFEAHPTLERDGTVDFGELLDLRASRHRDVRRREEAALAAISDQIGIELDKGRQVSTLTRQVTEKERLVARYDNDRKSLLPKGEKKANQRLQELVAAAEVVRWNLRFFSVQQAALEALGNEVQDVRQNRAPEALRQTKERHSKAGLAASQWDEFLLGYTGDVDTVISAKAAQASRSALSWRGVRPSTPLSSDGSCLAGTADPKETPLAVLEAEIERLEGLVAADKETAQRVAAITKRLGEEMAALERLRERLTDCTGAKGRAASLAMQREAGYIRVFDAVVGEERVLSELYGPLRTRLAASGGTLARLSFTVNRVVDVAAWSTRGEALFDLRGGPFKGIGSLEKEARTLLAGARTTGDSTAVSQAMSAFRAKHQEALLDRAPHDRTRLFSYSCTWLWTTRTIGR